MRPKRMHRFGCSFQCRDARLGLVYRLAPGYAPLLQEARVQRAAKRRVRTQPRGPRPWLTSCSPLQWIGLSRSSPPAPMVPYGTHTCAAFPLVHDSEKLQMKQPEIERSTQDESGIKLSVIDNYCQFPAWESGIGRRLFSCKDGLVEYSFQQPAMLVGVSDLIARKHLRPLSSVRLKATKAHQIAPSSSTGRSPSALLLEDMCGPVTKLPGRNCAVHRMEACLFNQLAICPFRKGPIQPENLPPELFQEIVRGSNSKNLVQRKNRVCHLDSSGSRCGNGAIGLVPVSMRATAQAKHTARVFLSECRARRHGLGFWFAFNAAQRARKRAPAPTPLPAPLRTPALPAQLDLFA